MSANTATKIPAIAQIKGLPPLAVMALQSIKETLEVREGLHEPLDRFVSVRELADLILDDEKIVTYLGSGHSHDARYYTEAEWNLTAKGDLNVAQAAGVPGTLGVGVNNQLIRADSGATLGIEYFSLLGTSNQVTVTHNASDATLSLPQNIHSGASPTFANLMLSGLLAGVADYDKFIVSDTGVLKFRTGAEVLSDIGGAPYSFKTITGITNDVVADLAEDTLTLAVGNNKLSILGTAATDTITFTVNEGNIDHDQLGNFVAAKHINWSVTGPEDIHDDRVAVSSVTQHVGSIDHNSLLNTHNLTSHIDHGSISGLGDSADHTWALLVDGSRPLTADWQVGNFKIGINTVPAEALSVKGDFSFENAANTKRLIFGWQANYSDFWFYNGAGWTAPMGIADTKANLGAVDFYDGWIGIGNLHFSTLDGLGNIYTAGRINIADSTNTEKLNVAGNLMLSGAQEVYIKTDTQNLGYSTIYLHGAGETQGSVVAIGTGATSRGVIFACYGGAYSADHVTMYHTGSEGYVGTGADNLRLFAASGIVRIGNASSDDKIVMGHVGAWGVAIQNGSATVGTVFYPMIFSASRHASAYGGFVFRGKDAVGSELMVITEAGKVGIGTTSPIDELDIAGHLMLSGNTTSYIKTNTKDGSNNNIIHVVGAGTNQNNVLITGTGAASLGVLRVGYGGAWTVNQVYMYHDGTNGILGTLAGDLQLSPTGKILLKSGTGINEASIDGTLGGNSDDALPTEKAVKTYVDGKVVSGCRVYRNGVQAIPHATWTKAEFNAEAYDELGEYDHVTNYRFIAQVAGVYAVSSTCRFANVNDASWIIIQVRVNNVEYARGTDMTTGAATTPAPHISVPVKMTAGQYVEIFVYQSSGGGAVDIATGTLSYMVIQRMA